MTHRRLPGLPASALPMALPASASGWDHLPLGLVPGWPQTAGSSKIEMDLFQMVFPIILLPFLLENCALQYAI